jgi:hypothetical protein
MYLSSSARYYFWICGFDGESFSTLKNWFQFTKQDCLPGSRNPDRDFSEHFLNYYLSGSNQ